MQDDPESIDIELVEDGGDRLSETGAEIIHDDGSVTVSIDGGALSLLVDDDAAEKEKRWFRNLVEDIGDAEQATIAETLLDGIERDIQSRQDWIEAVTQGIRLLGLKVELPGQSTAGDSAPLDGMSNVRHPMLLEAVLRFQANCRGEFLPVDGPVKIRDDDPEGMTVQRNDLADALEKDMNHYLTVTASEFYPDTDQMFFRLGFAGLAFKKVYFCPLRMRPVSEAVAADDLIVNNSATDLQNAKRITHRIMMRPSVVKRMQILGVYQDTELTDPDAPDTDSIKDAVAEQQGISPPGTGTDYEDRDREIYECYCELNVPGFEHRWKGKETGLEVPYVVTLDVTSRKILAIRRNYDAPGNAGNAGSAGDDDDDTLPSARIPFVKYEFVPGLGFYSIGLLHVMANMTNAATAAWRLMLDAGMFGNFPGFLVAKDATRQNTNLMRVAPGSGVQIDTMGRPIKDAIMPLPYKEAGPGLMSLTQNIVETGQRVGGTAELQIGEGKQDAPVGTTIALIEQAQKVMSAVHKRMHTAQSQEFQLLLQCFRDHPESLWKKNKKARQKWDEATLVRATDDYDLVPQADPNTASHTQRVMKVMALKQLQASNPALYDPIAIDKAAIKAIGWANPEQFMAPPSALGKEPPDVQKTKAELSIKKQDADARMMDAETRRMALGEQEGAASGQITPSDELDALTRERERESRERVALTKFAETVVENPVAAEAVSGIVTPDFIRLMREKEAPIVQ